MVSLVYKMSHIVINITKYHILNFSVYILFYFILLFFVYIGRYDGWHIPLLYVLMTDKLQETYDEIFTVLKEIQPRLNPTDVVVDFEMAAINAIHANFSQEIEVHGCFFHFCQNIYRHVQSVGLQSVYGLDPDFAQNIKLLTALAFVPTDSVVDAYDQLVTYDFYDENSDLQYKDQIQALLSYFQTTYIYRINRNGNRNPPLFPPKLWNVYEQTLTGDLK